MKNLHTIQIILLSALLFGMSGCKKNESQQVPVAPPAEVKIISLTSLKALSTADEVKVPDAKKISGEADDQPGIVISFDAAQSFAAGDRLEVNVSGQKLLKQNGEIVLAQVPAANAKKTGTGTITAKNTSITEALKNAALWNGTLISLTEGAFSGGNGKYSGTLTFQDAGNNMLKSMVVSGAAFENSSYPASVGLVKGILRTRGKDIYLDLRTSADVSAGSISRLLTDEMYVTSEVKADMTFRRASETKTMHYERSGTMAYIPGDKFDGEILNKDRSYVYVVSSASNFSSAYFSTGASIDLKGLKEVGLGILNVPTILSADYKESGKFYTVKFKIPSREELIKAQGTGSEATVDAWLAAPDLMFSNQSTRSGGKSGNAPIGISRSKHAHLMDALFHLEKLLEQQEGQLQTEVYRELLERLYTDYGKKLSELGVLIGEYEQLFNEIKVHFVARTLKEMKKKNTKAMVSTPGEPSEDPLGRILKED
eukprot:gene19280-22937_t